MILNAYSIYDRKALQYHSPFFGINDAVAVRSFGDMANDSRTNIGTHPSDFVLYRVGTYNDQNGAMSPASPLVHVIDATATLRGTSQEDMFSDHVTLTPTA